MSNNNKTINNDDNYNEHKNEINSMGVMPKENLIHEITKSTHFSPIFNFYNPFSGCIELDYWAILG